MQLRQTKDANIFFLFSSITLLLFVNPATSNPQANLINRGCSSYNASDPSVFLTNLNDTYSDLRSQINGSARFATAQRVRAGNPVYALFQCRDYLSLSDCLSCFSRARVDIGNCTNAGSNGARVILDGCFLRYESLAFFSDTVLTGNAPVCGNDTARASNDSSLIMDGLMADLSKATPRMEGYFAVATRGSGRSAVHGLAQCTRTVTEDGCRNCLTVAYNNIRACGQYTQGRAVDGGCFMRYSNFAFFSRNFTRDLGPFLETGSSRNRRIAIVAGVAGGVGLVSFLVLLYVLVNQRSTKSKKPVKEDILGATELRGPVNFHYKDLKSATKNFSEDNKLGGGGFGDVYKGILKNGKAVAVKKLLIDQSNRAEASFEIEVKLISNVHHRNLVRLLGCCEKGSELLLVYEYMANSSLDKFLFGPKRGTLNWKQRFDIIIGTARGLAYLHEEFYACVIHRDIKSSNILLDENFQAKIADFGLAKLLPEDKSHLSTKFAGTLGYTAPEYAIHGQLSEKADTYSYGIVILEIISGRKSIDTKFEPVTQHLLEWTWRLYESDMLINLVDGSLEQDEYEIGEMKRIIEIALWCTSTTVASRPTMSEVVVLLLSKDLAVQQPSKPTFIDTTATVNGDTYNCPGSPASNATVSISQSLGR